MKLATNIVAVGLALAGVLSTAPAQAQNVRSFVSGLGSDTNNCLIATPCKSLQGAFLKTNASGQIVVLDSGGYAGGTTLTITKAISIINQNNFAGISVGSGGIGIVINAQQGDAVSLSGMTIDGYGIGLTGIQFNSGTSLTIENCVIRNMIQDGIDFLSSTAKSALKVSNSLVADNGNYGVSVLPTGSATAVFNHVEVNNNNTGIFTDGFNSAGTNTINATISESVTAGNRNVGFAASTSSGKAPTSLMVSHSVSANNGTGVFAQGDGTVGGTIRLANSTVTGNATGWVAQFGGVVDTYLDNYIDGNGPNTGSLTTIGKQ